MELHFSTDELYTLDSSFLPAKLGVFSHSVQFVDDESSSGEYVAVQYGRSIIIDYMK